MVARRNWTREWWSLAFDRDELVIGPPVIAELERGEFPCRVDALNLVGTLPVLAITEPILEIVEAYIAHKVMPADPAGDALHLALASFHRVDVLLTWNCRHLANPNKMEHIRLINYELGLPMPILTTPVNYLSGDESDG